MSDVKKDQVNCSRCGLEVADPSNRFCPGCGHATKAIAPSSPDAPGPTPGVNLASEGQSPVRRFALAIIGIVPIAVGALLLFVPFFDLDGEQVSIMQGRDLCSSAFGSYLTGCSSVSLFFFGGLVAVALGLALVFAGLVRGSQPATTQQGLASTAPPPAGEISRPVDLSITRPTTWSGWLTGLGSVLGAFAIFLPWSSNYSYFASWGLARPTNLVSLVALLGVAATVFIPDRIPDFAKRRLAILIVVFVGVGVGFDQLLSLIHI